MLSKLKIESTTIINIPFSEILFILILLAVWISYFLFVSSIHCLQYALLSKVFSNHNFSNVAKLLTQELQYHCWNDSVWMQMIWKIWHVRWNYGLNVYYGQASNWLVNYRLAREFNQALIYLKKKQADRATEFPEKEDPNTCTMHTHHAQSSS